MRFVRSAFKGSIAAGWLTPSEFWQTHPRDFWWLYEAKMDQYEKAATDSESVDYNSLEQLLNDSR